jgi:hypothetical protein
MGKTGNLSEETGSVASRNGKSERPHRVEERTFRARAPTSQNDPKATCGKLELGGRGDIDRAPKADVGGTPGLFLSANPLSTLKVSARILVKTPIVR